MQKLIVILGTNASGKSTIGIKLAKQFNFEIISADSRQVYAGFDLCSGKVSVEEMEEIPHHMINICNIGEMFSVADFQTLTYKLISDISNRGKIPMIVGGTGLYIDSVTQGYVLSQAKPDYELRKKYELMSMDDLLTEMERLNIKYCQYDQEYLSSKRRIIRLLEKASNGDYSRDENSPKYNTLQLGVTWPKEDLHRRIDERLSMRINKGMIEEVENYLKSGGNKEYLYNLGLEYRYICWYLSGKYESFDVFYDELSRAIKKFAKKQITWFKRNKDIIWLDMKGDYMEQAKKEIELFLEM